MISEDNQEAGGAGHTVHRHQPLRTRSCELMKKEKMVSNTARDATTTTVHAAVV